MVKLRSLLLELLGIGVFVAGCSIIASWLALLVLGAALVIIAQGLEGDDEAGE